MLLSGISPGGYLTYSRWSASPHHEWVQDSTPRYLHTHDQLALWDLTTPQMCGLDLASVPQQGETACGAKPLRNVCSGGYMQPLNKLAPRRPLTTEEPGLPIKIL